MIILDTDHMSLLEWDNEGSAFLREQLSNCSPESVATTIISYEEQVRGWMAYISRARSLSQQVEGYRRLRGHLENYLQVPVIDFDDVSAAQYQKLRRDRIRIGTMDLKIAAIAISQNAILLTRNLRDFGKVPGLRFEDWSS
jgi:tRNA(fMet)-specific endonuclease VapC